MAQLQCFFGRKMRACLRRQRSVVRDGQRLCDRRKSIGHFGQHTGAGADDLSALEFRIARMDATKVGERIADRAEQMIECQRGGFHARHFRRT